MSLSFTGPFITGLIIVILAFLFPAELIDAIKSEDKEKAQKSRERACACFGFMVLLLVLLILD